ncbi:hypothetical protein F3Y22_tig00110600pilonHSYRG00057 [Hibiscus syriacus]|uniref:Uncharacterized protein n=1 Tax=Hibiscus syriacus TaxID=106335 RepID=A0A6A3A3L1_HIBSY|nr:hypothetical protein F3Y22_tig00110600pilonHSYRG00057 [Hibiscus syriacus]
MAIDLLGPSLEDLFNYCSFDACRPINRVECMHSRGFIHRDMLLCLIPAAHVENKNLTGTARYASVNTHLGVVGHEILERLSGAVEAFARRNGSGHGLHGDQSRQRSSEDLTLSKEAQPDSDRMRSSRTDSLQRGQSYRAANLAPLPGFEPKASSFTPAAATRGGRDDTLRSFDLLTIGSGKRK